MMSTTVQVQTDTATDNSKYKTRQKEQKNNRILPSLTNSSQSTIDKIHRISTKKKARISLLINN